MLLSKKLTKEEINLKRQNIIKESLNNPEIQLDQNDVEKLVDLFLIFASQRTFTVKLTDIQSQTQLLQLDKESQLFTNVLNKMVQQFNEPIDFSTFIRSFVLGLGNTKTSEGLDEVFTTATSNDALIAQDLVQLGNETNIHITLEEAQDILSVVSRDKQKITREDFGQYYRENASPRSVRQRP